MPGVFIGASGGHHGSRARSRVTTTSLSFILSPLSFRGTYPSSLILYPSSFRNASLAKIHQSRRIRFASHSVLRDQPSCLKPFTLLRYGQTQESGITIERRRAEW